LKSVFKPEFVYAVTRKPRAYSGHPFIVEVGIAYGGEIKSYDRPQLIRFANKIPLLFDEASDVAWKVVWPKTKTKANDENKAKKFWLNYNVNFPAPLVVLVHVCSTKVPFKGVGKESIADVEDIEKEIRGGLLIAARKLREYLARKKREEEAKRRALSILKYVPEVARGLSTIVNDPDLEDKLAKKLVEIARSHLGSVVDKYASLIINYGKGGKR